MIRRSKSSRRQWNWRRINQRLFLLRKGLSPNLDLNPDDTCRQSSFVCGHMQILNRDYKLVFTRTATVTSFAVVT